MDMTLEAHGDPNALGPDVKQIPPESVIPSKSAPIDDITSPYLDHPVMPSLPPVSPSPTDPLKADENQPITNPEVQNEGKSSLQQGSTTSDASSRNNAIVDSLDRNK